MSFTSVPVWGGGFPPLMSFTFVSTGPSCRDRRGLRPTGPSAMLTRASPLSAPRGAVRSRLFLKEEPQKEEPLKEEPLKEEPLKEEL